MNSKTYRSLLKAILLSGAIGTGWAAHAQSSTTDNMSADSSSRKATMHRAWRERRAGDSLSKRDGGRWAGRDGRSPDGRGEGFGPGNRGEDFRRGGEGFHRGGAEDRQEWAHGGERGPRIHYTPEQRKQVMAINMDYHKKSSDLFKKDNITLKEYKAGLVALQKEKKSKLEALLTQKQKDELAARKKRISENMQVMAAARMERLKIRLNLSDDQVTKLKSGQESLRAQMQSIHENQDLLPQQKMEQLKDLAAKRQDNFKSVLTPEQLSKFQELSHRQRPGRFGGENTDHQRHPLGEETK
ncbi:MAG TPA: hypothetical protein VNS58_00705 [Puia sp.]|nr:hypothetical protein [Puia sp.]